MRIDILLYALPLFLGSTIAAPYPSASQSAAALSAPPAEPLTLIPIDAGSRKPLIKRSGRGGKFNLNGGRKKKDGSDAPKKPNNGGPSTPNPAKGKAIASKKKRTTEVKAESSATAAKREEAETKLSPDAKASTDAEIKAQTPPDKRPDDQRPNKDTKEDDEAEQKKKDDEHGVTAPALVITPLDLSTAWRKFERAPGGKGTDHVGWVNADDIGEGFSKCRKLGRDKYLFWSAGRGNGIWERAVIPAYAKATGRLKISDAARLCKKQAGTGLGSMGGRGEELARLAAEAARDRMMATVTPQSKKTGKRVEPRKATATQLKEAEGTMLYMYYWAEMSRGFAKAAEGSVEWFHPEGITIRPDMHWNAVELPEVRKNVPGKVTTVQEVTFPLGSDAPPFDFGTVVKTDVVLT